MDGLLEKIKNDALTLPVQQRAELAHVLLSSLEDETTDAAWDAELEKRVDSILQGKAQGIPADRVFAKLQLSEKDKTLSDFIEAALQFYIENLRRSDTSDNDIEIINRNADYLNQETRDALQYQAEL